MDQVLAWLCVLGFLAVGWILVDIAASSELDANSKVSSFIGGGILMVSLLSIAGPVLGAL